VIVDVNLLVVEQEVGHLLQTEATSKEEVKIAEYPLLPGAVRSRSMSNLAAFWDPCITAREKRHSP